MNNLLEEDEDELESETVGEVIAEKATEPKANGAHLSSETFFDDDKNEKDPPVNQEVSGYRVNGFKTETRI
jgi:hypothetical protein